MNNLLYLSYGEGLHEQEVVFSLFTALRVSPGLARHCRILVFTDRPSVFAALPVEVHEVKPEQWVDWSGPWNFAHRRKILALGHALKTYGGPIVLLDGDTWFRRPVEMLFDRVGPGRAVMHLREGVISEIRSPLMEKLTAFLGSRDFSGVDGKSASVSPHEAMWNAGVVGLDPADAGLLEDVRHLTDGFCQCATFHVLEQFAFSHVLSTRTRLSEAEDLIFHYWPPYLHEPFRKRLPVLMRETEALPLAARAARLFAGRPRPTLPRRGKVILKRCLQAAGILKGRARSSEW